MTRYFFYALAILFFCGCSSTKPPKNSETQFTTRITSSGLKHFQIQLLPLETELRTIDTRNTRRRNGAPNAPTSERSTRRTESILVAQANMKIAETGYCKEGYWLLDKNLFGHSPLLRGECNDLATNIDRTQFPDTILRW